MATEQIVRPLNPKSIELLRSKLNAYVDAMNAIVIALGLEGEWTFNPQGGYLVQVIETPATAPTTEKTPLAAVESESSGAASDGVDQPTL